jgi:hypothetical protein
MHKPIKQDLSSQTNISGGFPQMSSFYSSIISRNDGGLFLAADNIRAFIRICQIDMN